MPKKKKISFKRLSKEVFLDINRSMLNESEPAPSLKTIENIIKTYEDYIALYLVNNCTVRTRMGTWALRMRTKYKHKGVLITPRKIVTPEIRFSKIIKDFITNNTPLIVQLRENSTIGNLPPAIIDQLKWDLKNPKRDFE